MIYTLVLLVLLDDGTERRVVLAEAPSAMACYHHMIRASFFYPVSMMSCGVGT